MWELDYKESLDAFELWCWRLLRVPWTARRFNQSNSLKEIRDQSWVFIEGRVVEAETPILWSPDAKSWLIWKDSDAGKIEGRRRMGQQRMSGWMASPTQWTWVWVDSRSWWWPGGLVCCGSRGHKQSDMTEWLNWIDPLNFFLVSFSLYLAFHFLLGFDF